jgi:hypothetical protein
MCSNFLVGRSTIHKTEARFVSGLGWGLKKRIEEYSASRFKNNIEKVCLVDIHVRLVLTRSFPVSTWVSTSCASPSRSTP